MFLDSYAGRGRHADGRPASAELVLRMAQNQGNAVTVAWTCFFVEAEGDSAAQLIRVVNARLRRRPAPSASSLCSCGATIRSP